MNISTISDSDYIHLVANYITAVTGEVDPSLILRERGYSPEQIRAVEKNGKKIETNFLRFSVSLHNFKYPQLGYVVTLFEHYEKGTMPFPGSVSEQPAQIMDIFRILAMLKIEHEARLQKKR